ncbi:MAG: glycosyltransferase family 2 protein [Planctomyces sp.]|nr:glycosyltransferase family 2 protein [Planctomyces sp.]
MSTHERANLAPRGAAARGAVVVEVAGQAGATLRAGPSAGAIRSVGVIVPTYREALNIPLMIERVGAVRRALRGGGVTLSLVFMDDNSRDGSVEAVARAAASEGAGGSVGGGADGAGGADGSGWARIVVRTTQRGLSPAVIDGLRSCDADAMIVMDADLSHPPEKIPEMIAALEAGAEFVIGSRYTPGGTTAGDWGLFRRLNSSVATLIARPLTRAKDPMAGYFGLRRETFERADALSPIGYKIGLELLVKCRVRRLAEVPIHFADRVHGQSKLSLKEQVRYLRHVRRLLTYKHPNLAALAQFGLVGASGMAVNMGTVLAAERLGAGTLWALRWGIGVSILSNFALNRRFTFGHARGGSVVTQLVGFVLTCLVGAVIQYVVTARALSWLAEGSPTPLAVPFGVAAGMAFNFLISRYVVFARGGSRV